MQPVHVLIVTGQSSRHHDWTRSSRALAAILDSAGTCLVTTVTSPPPGGDFRTFRPPFEDFEAVLVDYEGDDWPPPTQDALTTYVRRGGGLVLVHATDNAFPRWPAFQTLCGVGGWGGRDESAGPKVRWRDGRVVLDDSPGTARHPPLHEFDVVTRRPDHPVMEGLPTVWRHRRDELYSQLRGPARHLEVLATACADPARHPKATGEHEPVLMTVRYGAGRVFHTTLGHVGPDDPDPPPAVACVGFITTLRRGVEWAGRGTVTSTVPIDFPTADGPAVDRRRTP